MQTQNIEANLSLSPLSPPPRPSLSLFPPSHSLSLSLPPPVPLSLSLFRTPLVGDSLDIQYCLPQTLKAVVPDRRFVCKTKLVIRDKTDCAFQTTLTFGRSETIDVYFRKETKRAYNQATVDDRLC